MIIDRFNYTVTASIRFSKAELDFLVECANGHYDAAVRSLVCGDRNGNGILTVMGHYIAVPYVVDTRELDLMLKALEQAEQRRGLSLPILRSSIKSLLLECNSRTVRLAEHEHAAKGGL